MNLNSVRKAKALLETALQDGSSSKLSNARRYFHTKAGVKRPFSSVDCNLDRGRSVVGRANFSVSFLAVPGSAAFDPVVFAPPRGRVASVATSRVVQSSLGKTYGEWQLKAAQVVSPTPPMIPRFG